VEIVARPKGAKNKVEVKKHVFKDPTIEEIVEVEVEFNCPVRGKIKQKVKVKKLKKVVNDQRTFVGAQSIIDDIEKEEGDISTLEPDPED
jgi:hypothetical protein